MTPIVLDASVTMSWVLAEEDRERGALVLDALQSRGAAVPALWRLEICNVLLVAQRRRRVTESAALRFLTLLQDLPIEIDDAPPDMVEVVAAGGRHGLSAYDATYLLLAERLGAPLATFDDRLARAAIDAGVQIFLAP